MENTGSRILALAAKQTRPGAKTCADELVSPFLFPNGTFKPGKPVKVAVVEAFEYAHKSLAMLDIILSVVPATVPDLLDSHPVRCKPCQKGRLAMPLAPTVEDWLTEGRYYRRDAKTQPAPIDLDLLLQHEYQHQIVNKWSAGSSPTSKEAIEQAAADISSAWFRGGGQINPRDDLWLAFAEKNGLDPQSSWLAFADEHDLLLQQVSDRRRTALLNAGYTGPHTQDHPHLGYRL